MEKVYLKLFVSFLIIVTLFFGGCDNKPKDYISSQWVNLCIMRFDIADEKLDSVTDLYETYIHYKKEQEKDITYTIRLIEGGINNKNGWTFIHAAYYDNRQFEHLLYVNNERLLGYIRRDSIDFLLFTNVQNAFKLDKKLSKLIIPTDDYKYINVKILTPNKHTWKYESIFDHSGVFSVYREGKIDSIYMDYD